MLQRALTEQKRTRRTRRVAPAGAPVLAYVRVSTDEQAESGAGMDAQRASLQAEAERRGWTDRLVWIEDAGYSAKDLDRPGMRRALDMLAAGKASVLLATKVDRLSRSVRDFSDLMAESERAGWAIIVQDLGMDSTTPTGRMLWRMLAVFAELERDMTSERTKRGMAAIKARGGAVSRPGLSSELRDRLRVMRESGQGYQSIADTLNAKHVPTARGGTWHPSTVYNALQVRP